MHMLAELPPAFWPLLICFFVFIILVVLLSYADAYAEGGWSSFAKRYRAQT
jgi:hypothetical protein